MHTMAANRPFKTHRKINHFLRSRICFVFFLQIRLSLNCVFQFYMMPHHWIWHQFRNAVCLSIWHFKYARHVTHGVFRHHLTKSTNISHARLTIFLRTIFNHLITTVILNISINIRHTNTIWIQKALKEQIIFQRIYFRNFNRVRQKRPSRRTTPRSINNPLILTPVNKVLHNQKVAVIAHLINNAQLILNAFVHFIRQ